MSAETMVAEIRRRSGWSIFTGAVLVVLGIALIAHPFAAGTISTVVVGLVLSVGGIAELALAFASQTPGGFFLRLLLGAFYLLTGVVLLAYPFTGLESLTLFAAVMLIARGVVAAFAAYEVRGVSGWGWLLVDALASIATGIFILARWPWSSAHALGILVGAAVLATGLTRIMVATRIHSTTGGTRQALGHT